ncbi:MAG: hypothetical protein HC800_24870 [Phormidesmis sp. RL_2_1]|nr:hypothetical protein [Phormidesmis sp. RL_2_1]
MSLLILKGRLTDAAAMTQSLVFRGHTNGDRSAGGMARSPRERGSSPTTSQSVGCSNREWISPDRDRLGTTLHL